MDDLQIEERMLVQNKQEELPETIGIKTGKYTEGVQFIQGKNTRYNIREGMNLSIYDLQINAPAPSSQSVVSTPCVAITILLEAAGEGKIVDPSTHETLAIIPHKPGLTYISIMNKALGSEKVIPKKLSLKGIDIRLSFDFIKAFHDFPQFRDLNASHHLHQHSSDIFWVGYLSTPRKTLEYVNNIIKLSASDDVNDLLLEADVLNILSDIIGLMNPQRHQIQNNAVMLTRKDKRLIKQAHEIMLESLSHPWTIKELATRVGLNQKKLKSGFRAEYGIPVYRFLQRERLRFARQLLEETNLSVTDISLKIGYANPSHFAFLFKREFGCTPSKMKF